MIEAEISRRLAGTVVASGGYRYLAFRPTGIHQLQPAITWYHRRGELGARLFATRSVAGRRTSSAVQVSGTQQLVARLRLTAGAVHGDRVFDVASLPEQSARTTLGYASLLIGLTARDGIYIGGALGREEPDFDYRSFTLGYRRTF